MKMPRAKASGVFFFPDSKRESPQALSFAEYEYVHKTIRWFYYFFFAGQLPDRLLSGNFLIL